MTGMGMADELAALTTGRKERRADFMVNLETDAAITIMADRMGGANMRSEACRRIMARGIALEPELMRQAIEIAKRERERNTQ